VFERKEHMRELRIGERPTTKCIEWQGKRDGWGFPVEPICKPDRKLVHLLAWVARRGPIPKGMHLFHHCDNLPCINVQHMFLGTDADKRRDLKLKKAYPARLSEKVMREALRELNSIFNVDKPKKLRRNPQRPTWG